MPTPFDDDFNLDDFKRAREQLRNAERLDPPKERPPGTNMAELVAEVRKRTDRLYSKDDLERATRLGFQIAEAHATLKHDGCLIRTDVSIDWTMARAALDEALR